MFFSRVLQQKDNIHSQLFNDEMVDLLSTTYTMPENFNATIITVGPDEVARPDLLSKILYSDEMYADILCKINGISNPYELNEGMKIVCPSMEDLNRFIVHPSQSWREVNIGSNLSPLYLSGEDNSLGKEASMVPEDSPAVVRRMGDGGSKISTSMPVQKAKTKKHRPSESLIGDKRFSIKGAENVVIY